MQDVINKLLKYFKVPAQARNDAGERIESMRFSVPALRVGVLEYGPGQLQTGNAALDGKPVKLYYPPEAVSDDKFLKSLETAPVIVGGHDSTTNEQNKKIDGWAHSVFFDAAANAAMIAGVVKGAKEVAYVKGNLGSAGFGASAFVDIYDLKVENGITPDGQEYNAIANELRATHVALAPHVRDPENKIKVINAVCINTGGEMLVENAKFGEPSGVSKKTGEFITSRVYHAYRYSIYKHPSFGFVAIDDEHKKPFAIASTEKAVDDLAKQSIDSYLGKVKNSRGECGEENTITIDPAAFAAAVKNAVKNVNGMRTSLSGKKMVEVKVTYDNGTTREMRIEEDFGEANIKDLFPIGKMGRSGNGDAAEIKSVKIKNSHENSRGEENTITIDPAAFAAAVKNVVRAEFHKKIKALNAAAVNGMNVKDIITLARKHLGKGVMDSSARLCLSDAIRLYDAGDLESAKIRALKSIAYSIGILSDDYRKASQ